MVAPKMNSINVQKCDPESSKKKALIQSFKKKVPLKVFFLMLHTHKPYLGKYEDPNVAICGLSSNTVV